MRLVSIAVCLVVLLGLGMFAAAYLATNAPNRTLYEYNLLFGVHRMTFMLVPCTATDSGYLFAGYDMFISSWRNGPPMVTLPTAPPCP